VTGPYYYSGSEDSKTLAHQTFADHSNDTSVVVVTEGAEVNISFSDIYKTGYASNLFQSSFFGVNAAVNVANKSSAHLSHVNITTHNGAANVYAFGTDTTVYVDDADLYSSGPTAHGLYASGNGTIIGRNVRHYSGGNRCSSFAGDSPAGYIYVYDSLAHTNGIGSAIFYALGEIHATNVLGRADKAPIMFMDGPQTANWVNVDLTAGLLAGTIMFSSSTRQSGSILNVTDSRLTVLPTTAPGLWFGNVISSAYLLRTEVITTSGILVVANYSQVTQDFDYYAGYPDNNDLLPAIASVTVAESDLTGDLVAYNSSSISFSLGSYSSWTGAAYSGYKTAYFAVSLDTTSKWTLTKDTTLTNFTNTDTTLSNIISNGHSIYYDPCSEANKWLKGGTKKLPGGGKVAPTKANCSK